LYFRFTDFEIDIARHELRRAGTIVHIEPQVFDLLVHLVRNRDRTVGKDELFDVIWEGRIVSEATLSSRINAARRALRDNGNDQSLIRTVYKRGFRFVGDVDDVGAAPAAVAIERAASPHSAAPDAAMLVATLEPPSLPDTPLITAPPFRTWASVRTRNTLRMVSRHANPGAFIAHRAAMQCCG
jgi:DNA-binding winged helix-turn-helix (wHTH) protein